MKNNLKILENYIEYNTNNSHFDDEAEEALLRIKELLTKLQKNLKIIPTTIKMEERGKYIDDTRCDLMNPNESDCTGCKICPNNLTPFTFYLGNDGVSVEFEYDLEGVVKLHFVSEKLYFDKLK